ncbi:type 1 fimbria pilin [Acinetobacter calcoaceticus]|uniref:Type 1 fimbria pilin n=1 Tax=Acinetobacter calcoaceticus TaxID=471 RepID=A0A4R1XCE5_ACICA|nr:type 1 fimbria pilin [Acinetobacter calcoaceticus]
MLKISKTLVLILAAGSTTAFAADGTITINGKVLDSTCALTPDGGPAQGNKNNITVTLPTVKAGDFSAVGDVEGKTDFQLKITNGADGQACGSLSGIQGVLISAANGKYLASNSTALINQKAFDEGSAGQTPIHVQILSGANNDPIKFDSSVAVPHKDGVIKLASQYLQAVDGPIAAQNVTAVVDYTLVYN